MSETNEIKPVLETFIPSQKDIDFLPTIYTPWLTSISEDGTIWNLKGGSGAKEKTKILDFNFLLPDGSLLTDTKNKHFYNMARSYAWVFRLYSPQCDAIIHISRVRSLVTFFYWLRLQNVSLLSSVTTDHIDIFSEKVAFGNEWVREAPDRLYKYLVHVISAHEKLPRIDSNSTVLSRKAIYHAAGINIIASDGNTSFRNCAEILNWLGVNGKEDADLSELECFFNTIQANRTATTVQNIHRNLMPLEELWSYRHHLPGSSLKGKPFFRGASDRAAQLGVKSNRHPTIPPHLGIEYISGALTWVLDYATIVTDEVFIAKKISVSQLSKRLQNAGLAIEVHTKQVSRSLVRKTNVTRLVEILSAACFVVIAALSARRVDEIADLGADCVVRDDDGHYWLKVYIEKTNQRYDQIPVPVAVQRAISCMELISKTARESSGTDSIWQMKVGALHQIKPNLHLDRLAFFSGVVRENEKEWHFTAHQFRRFFAILYFWRYEKGDLPGLSHHLRHFDLEMTKRYVTDAEMGRVWKEVEAEWQADFIRGVIDGSRNVGGKAGVRIKKEGDKLMSIFRKSVDVVAPERVIETLQRLAKRLGSEFRQHVWGTICACPQKTKFSEHARCKGSERTGPVFKNASEDLCASCPFAIHTEQFSVAAAKDLELRKITGNCSGSDTILSELSEIQIVSLESLLKNAQPIPLLPEENNG